MALGQTPVTVIGNLTADPELRFTPNGVPVASFTVASTERRLNKETGKYDDGDTLFLRCNLWRQDAENLCESAAKGARVMVTGSLKQRSYETKEGEKRTVYELQAEEVGVSLKWSTAKLSKVNRNHGPVPEDPWSKDAPVPDGPGGGFTEEPPF
jgi:single-strand DNA-binding protein